jgi:alpha-D-xyloside xylohydrolase
MKFTDGYWLYRKGFSALHPRDVSDVVEDERSLTVYAPTKRIDSRGDALNLPQLTVTFDAPLPDVIGVTIEHFQGGLDNGPHFDVNRTGTRPASPPAGSRHGSARTGTGGLISWGTAGC